MATQWQTFPIEFRGGLISNLSPLQHGTNAVGSATVLQNFEPNKEGGYTKLKGITKYSDTALAGSGPVLALKVVSATRVVAARKNSSNYTQYYYGTGTTWTSMATSASTNGGKARHAEFNFDGDDKTVFVDGTNYPAVYDSSDNSMTFMTSSDSSDVSGAEHVAIFKNTAFYSKGNTVFFTAPFTVDDFSAANGAGSVNVGHDVTGMAVFRDQLIIFTTDTIRRLTGNTSADFQMASITDRIGCINGDTIQEVGGDIMYLAPDGIRLLSATDRIGDFALNVASDIIKKDATDFLASTTNFASVILRKKAQYRIFAYKSANTTANSEGLIATKFSSQGASQIGWATIKGLKAHVADSTYSSDDEVAMIGEDNGYVYKLDTGNDFDGTNITAVYESPYMPINDPQIRKTFYKMTIYAKPEGSMNIDVNIKYDFDQTNLIQPPVINVLSTGDSVFLYGSGGTLYGSATFGGELDSVYPINIVGSGKVVAIRIQDSSDNPAFTLDTALLEFRQHDRQ